MIIYVTIDSYWDTDIYLLPQLAKIEKTNCYVLNLHKNNKFERKKIEGINIEQYNRQNKIYNLSSILLSIKLFLKINKLVNIKDTLIYTYHNDPIFNILLLSFFRKKRVIISLHNFLDHIDAGLIEKFLKKMIIKKFVNFHFHSKIQYDLFGNQYKNKNAFFTVMPTKDYGEIVKKRKFNENLPKKFLFFGYIREYKNLELLIKVFNESDINAKLIIAGYSDKWSRYESLIRDRKKFDYDIRVIGNNEIPYFFSESDFVILPYKDSTQSGPLLIAINYGIPVIASNILAFNGLIKNGENGFLFENNDAASLKGVLINAINISLANYEIMVNNQLKLKLDINKDYFKNVDRIENFLKKLH